jgi:hypothetical protein
MSTIKHFAIAAAACATFTTTAVAVLPPAQGPSPERAKELAAKAAWSEKVAAYKLCQVQDGVADAYRKEMKEGGRTPPPPVSTGECADPGPAPTPASQKPLEASQAHSPPGNATSPPSTNVPAADSMGSKRQ